MRRLLDLHLGEGWTARAADPQTWAPVDDIPAADLWAARCEQRAALVDLVRERAAVNRLTRGDAREYVEAAATMLDPGALTIGFARRIATYKRIGLLVADRERALALLGDDHRVQLVIAGKAHFRDEEAKRTLQALFTLKDDPRVSRSTAFLDDYDVEIAAALVQGCDVWLNLPRPPLEASGTSGMKSAVNGGVNVSVLDGWWAEACDGTNGWGLDGSVEEGDQAARDWRDAQATLDVLQHEVAPLFARRGEDGLPHDWLARVRASLRTVGPRFSATRMVREYAEDVYRLR
jgi:starch phosphorylase